MLCSTHQPQEWIVIKWYNKRCSCISIFIFGLPIVITWNLLKRQRYYIFVCLALTDLHPTLTDRWWRFSGKFSPHQYNINLSCLYSRWTWNTLQKLPNIKRIQSISMVTLIAYKIHWYWIDLNNSIEGCKRMSTGNNRCTYEGRTNFCRFSLDEGTFKLSTFTNIRPDRQMWIQIHGYPGPVTVKDVLHMQEFSLTSLFRLVTNSVCWWWLVKVIPCGLHKQRLSDKDNRNNITSEILRLNMLWLSSLSFL